VDAEKPDEQSRTLDGWLQPAVVKLLIERGYEGEVRRQARRGDWFCALGLARELDRRGERDAVLELLRPYAGPGRTEAADATAKFLGSWGRAGEAIDLIRPLAESGDRIAVNHLAGLLAGEGRLDEVFALLVPRFGDWFHAEALFRLAEGAGRDNEILDLLPAVSPQGRATHHAVDLRTRVLERLGRVDEALRYLRSHVDGGWVLNVNHVQLLADMMIRHGRMTEVRDLVAGRGGQYAARRLASFLAGQGDADAAIAVLSPFIEAGALNCAALAARLLEAHGRADEAIEVLRSAAEDGYDDWVVHTLSDLLAGRGRADEAIALADVLAGQPGWTADEVLTVRTRALAASGRRDQAIAEIRAHPGGCRWWVAHGLAELLAEEGRSAEAIEILSQPGCAQGGNGTVLATLLVQADRVAEAIAVSHVGAARRSAPGPKTPPF
jgi:tetratricopeptide (TPR) repeat protein